MCGQTGNPGGGAAREMPVLLGPLRHPCDLDLLLFFHRHPRVLMTSERLAAYVGYDVKQGGRSLDTLLDAAVLQRSPNPTHVVCLYALRGAADRAWLESRDGGGVGTTHRAVLDPLRSACHSTRVRRRCGFATSVVVVLQRGR